MHKAIFQRDSLCLSRTEFAISQHLKYAMWISLQAVRINIEDAMHLSTL